MAKPSGEDVVGYDLIIWIDEDGDPILSSYSELGEKYIRSIVPTWDGMKSVVIHATNPPAYMESLPRYLVTGVQNPVTKIVYPTRPKVLQ